jgi:hypothetical protein
MEGREKRSKFLRFLWMNVANRFIRLQIVRRGEAAPL